MVLQHLEISAVRNLIHVSLDCSPTLNLIVGANASGKTSLLEAIHLLGVARSFRTHKIQNVIHTGSNVATVFGRVVTAGGVVPVGVAKTRDGETTIRIGGKATRSVAQLAQLLPLQLVTPASQFLIEAGPKHRRAFLDWGLFHVEQSFQETWQRYVRAVRQRNALLRSGKANLQGLEHWDRGLAPPGELIHQLREAYVAALAERTDHYLEILLPGTQVQQRYWKGWGGELSLGEALAENRARDLQLGHTGIGPHRADLRLSVEGRPAAEILSRGQQKLLVAALRLAQVELLRARTGRSCTVLVDDLAAELDQSHRRLLMGLLSELGAQLFVTATDPALLETSAFSQPRMFHVEHGQVRAVV